MSDESVRLKQFETFPSWIEADLTGLTEKGE
jgi:hypothetical protein